MKNYAFPRISGLDSLACVNFVCMWGTFSHRKSHPFARIERVLIDRLRLWDPYEGLKDFGHYLGRPMKAKPFKLSLYFNICITTLMAEESLYSLNPKSSFHYFNVDWMTLIQRQRSFLLDGRWVGRSREWRRGDAQWKAIRGRSCQWRRIEDESVGELRLFTFGIRMGNFCIGEILWGVGMAAASVPQSA